MFEQILAAAKRLQGFAHRTPVMTSSILDARLGAQIFLKCENFQRVGAFKVRGAYNAVSKLPEEVRTRGVMSYSSGNHAQAMAIVGRTLGVPTLIVMPEDAPATKLAATKGYGAEVVMYDPATEAREEVADQIRQERGLTLIPPFDHPDVICGQGTSALELLQDVPGIRTILAPCGGGGLLTGTAIAAHGVNADIQVIGIEPELADDATRSFRTGTLQSVHNPRTIADGTRTASMGKHTFPLMMEHVHDMQTVTEEEIKDAVRFLFYTMKLVVEPSGALPLAALLAGRVEAKGQMGLIVSGGNIDGSTMSSILDSAKHS